MQPLLIVGEEHYEFLRASQARGTEPVPEYRRLLRRVVDERHPGNLQTLRRLAAEFHPGARIERFSDEEILSEIVSRLERRNLVIVRRVPVAAPVVMEAETPKPPPARVESRPALRVRIVDVAFLSDHQKLKDNDKIVELADAKGRNAAHPDWRGRGKKYPKPEWTPERSHPVTHTKNQEVEIEITIRAEPEGAAAVEGPIIGRGFLNFEGRGVVRPGDNKFRLTSTNRLPDRISRVEGSIDWTVDSLSAGTSAHRIYVTHDRPQDGNFLRWEEDGVTVNRIEAAMKLVEGAKDRSPHGIVQHLIGLYKYYSLASSEIVPVDYRHPSYLKFDRASGFTGAGGAWPLAEDVSRPDREYGECQAICRLVRGVIRQLGEPGDARVVVIWADPDVEGGAKALEQEWEKGGGLAGRTKRVDGRDWYAYLLDKPIADADVGRVFPPSHSTLPDGTLSPGINNFEACLKFSDGTTTKYYGGGAGGGGSDSAKEILDVFQCLCWCSTSVLPSGDVGFRIEEIVRRYR